MLNEIRLACHMSGDESRLINSESWAVSELYCSFLKELDTGKVVKVNINIRQDWGELLNDYKVYDDVIIFRKNFDSIAYSSLNSDDRKQMQLEIIHKEMMVIAEKEGWEKSHLLDAYNKCLEKKLKYQFDVGKLKASPNRKHKIGFWCNWDIDVFEVYWVLYDKKGNELKRKKFIEKLPYDGEFIYYTKWKWLNNSKVLLEHRYRYGPDESWEIDLPI